MTKISIQGMGKARQALDVKAQLKAKGIVNQIVGFEAMARRFGNVDVGILSRHLLRHYEYAMVFDGENWIIEEIDLGLMWKDNPPWEYTEAYEQLNRPKKKQSKRTRRYWARLRASQ